MYRNCYLMAGMSHEYGHTKLEARESIFKWANENGIFLELNVNNVVNKAYNDQKLLTSDVHKVHVSKKDIEEIKRRFDNKNVRIIALGFLCYAKQFADDNGEFELSMAAFGNWIGIHYTNILKRYLQELVDFDYIEKISMEKVKSMFWENSAKSKMNRYRIKVPIKNYGSYTLEGNDIRKLYNSIF